MIMDRRLKLYQCDVTEDCEFITVLVVAESEEDARKQIEEMDWSCFMGVYIIEIKDVNGHKIIVQ